MKTAGVLVLSGLMQDKREHTNHPYLEDREDDRQKNVVLWDTNALFPVRRLIAPGSENQTNVEPVAKIKEKTHSAPKIQQDQSIAGMDTLSPFAQWLMSLKPSSIHGHPDEHIDTMGSVSGTAVKEGAKESGKKKKKKKKKKKEARQRSEGSLSELPVLDTDIVSDTLAELIASQGHIEEAIAMYRKLVTHHPEKTAHYIQRISELRQGKA